eukprot:1623808-Rhodomonas_salina.1
MCACTRKGCQCQRTECDAHGRSWKRERCIMKQTTYGGIKRGCPCEKRCAWWSASGRAGSRWQCAGCCHCCSGGGAAAAQGGCTAMTCLTLSGNHFGDGGAGVLAGVLGECNALAHLGLNHHQWFISGSEGVDAGSVAGVEGLGSSQPERKL